MFLVFLLFSVTLLMKNPFNNSALLITLFTFQHPQSDKLNSWNLEPSLHTHYRSIFIITAYEQPVSVVGYQISQVPPLDLTDAQQK